MKTKSAAKRERQAIIAVAFPDGQDRKVARIVVTGDSSINVLAPYHPIQTGRIVKLEMPTGRFTGGIVPHMRVPYADSISVDRPVKLSLHPSGFVQFSAASKERFESGLTRPFLIPKGFGVHSYPFTDPIETGPTFGLMFNDIGSCEALDGNEQVRIIRFDETEIDDTEPHDGRSRHVYMVYGYILPASLRPLIQRTPSGPVLDYRFSALRPDWIVRYRTIELPTRFAFLAICVGRSHVPKEGQRGWSISGPRDLTHRYCVAGVFFPEGDEEDGEAPAHA